MFNITIVAPRDQSGKEPSVQVVVPTLPREGDHIAHDASGISGYVRGVTFWWEENGDGPEIEVRVK